MTDEHVFGSGRLTPDLLREASFTGDGGRYDAAEVRTFLERAASALDVLMSEDASLALRAEFSRNAEIAQQVLDAGQTASEQLRRQAGEDARRIIDETREATSGLRQAVELELADSRAEVTSMRGQLVGDLRDLYDRIGASLYRFERAAQQQPAEPAGGSSPVSAPSSPTPSPELPADRREQVAADVSPLEFRAERRVELPVEERTPAAAGAAEPPVDEASGLSEGVMPPAWQQLPPHAWAAEGTPEEPPVPPTSQVVPPDSPPSAPVSDPFLLVEDEPLAPGEPLVDLRDGGSDGPPAHDVASPPAQGAWLEGESAAATAAAPEDDVSHDNALAEALIARSSFDDVAEPAAAAPAAPEVAAAVTEPEAGASPDALAVRQLILNSLSDGHPREAVEAYLRDHLGLLEPGVLVDAALGAVGGPAVGPADAG